MNVGGGGGDGGQYTAAASTSARSPVGGGGTQPTVLTAATGHWALPVPAIARSLLSAAATSAAGHRQLLVGPPLPRLMTYCPSETESAAVASSTPSFRPVPSERPTDEPTIRLVSV